MIGWQCSLGQNVHLSEFMSSVTIWSDLSSLLGWSSLLGVLAGILMMSFWVPRELVGGVGNLVMGLEHGV
jgi:hypothetical protein